MLPGQNVYVQTFAFLGRQPDWFDQITSATHIAQQLESTVIYIVQLFANFAAQQGLLG